MLQKGDGLFVSLEALCGLPWLKISNICTARTCRVYIRMLIAYNIRAISMEDAFLPLFAHWKRFFKARWYIISSWQKNALKTVVSVSDSAVLLFYSICAFFCFSSLCCFFFRSLSLCFRLWLLLSLAFLFFAFVLLFPLALLCFTYLLTYLLTFLFSCFLFLVFFYFPLFVGFLSLLWYGCILVFYIYII